MFKPVLYLKNEKDYSVLIDAISDWDGFDKILHFLKVNYKIKILNQFEGPDARRYILEIDGIKIEMIHDDNYGNYIMANNNEAEALANTIGKDIESRLMNSKFL